MATRIVYLSHLSYRDIPITVSDEDTMEMVKSYFEKQVSSQDESALIDSDICFMGQRFEDHRRVSELKTEDDKAPVLLGKLTIHIKDLACDVRADLNVNGYDTFAMVKNMFGQRTSRFILRDSKLWLRDQLMVDEQTVSSVELAHDDTLSFQNAEFEISIREEHASDQDVIKLMVTDALPVEELRALYGEASRRALVDKDQIQFVAKDDFAPGLLQSVLPNETERDRDRDRLQGNQRGHVKFLKPGHLLHQYRIRPFAQLEVVREKAKPEFEYLCQNCGHDVFLKSVDKLACRVCGYRILLKKRTNNPDSQVFECI